MKNKIFTSTLLILAFALSACGAQATPTPSAVPATQAPSYNYDAPQATETEAPLPTETEIPDATPAVEVSDQGIADGSVTVPSVTMAVDGWVVIHTTNAEGKPGPVIGYAQVPAGTSSDVQVSIDTGQVTPKLFAMLHIDAGMAGMYEFPGDDVPVKNGDTIVMKPFNLTGLQSFVRTSDQSIQNGTVTVDAAYMLQPGWVVIHTTNDEGKPGPVIGYAALPEGFSNNVVVDIDEASATSQLFSMLHLDAGTAGTYEFPGDDVPVKNGDAIVMVPFKQGENSASSGINISGFSFSPGTLEIKVGTTVTWTNMDSTKHTVTSDTNAFDSGSLGQGDTFSFTFNEVGEFPYHCEIHSLMNGTIVVVP